MSGTNDSSSEFKRTTWNATSGGWRVFWFVVAVAACASAVAWIDVNVWRQMKQLESDFGTVRTERFQQSAQLRLALRALNDQLLQYQINGQRLELIQFRVNADEFERLLKKHLSDTVSAEEHKLVEEIIVAFGQYRGAIAPVEERSGFLTSTRTRAEDASEMLEKASGPLFDMFDRLLNLQRSYFTEFLGSSQVTLDSFQWHIKLSLAVLIVLAVLVMVLTYRWMIAPLHHQLTATHALIARQEKLAALGSMAAGVAHEVRNPLTAIKFRLFSLKKSLPPDMADNEDAALISDEINRLERIVRDFLDFARPSNPERSRVTVRRLLTEVARLMRPQLEDHGVEISVEASDDLIFEIDSEQIKQVLINLVRNAADSIVGDGSIRLRALSDQRVLDGRRQPAGIIEVVDNGPGISPEIADRLFDPFVTTREGGTGLGLSIAARIVEKHGGELHHQPNKDNGGGTIFSLVLPANSTK